VSIRSILILLYMALTISYGAARAQDGLSTEVQELLTKAKAGDVQAQFRLGAAYDYGRGVPRDGNMAMQWYRAAADAGDAEAQNSVGSGLQAEKKYSEALPWYEKASAQGHALATNNLAYLYDMGLGTTQDRKRGFALYSKAADLGWAEAMWNLANMYGAGQVGKPDLLMACVWTIRAQKFAASAEKQLLAHAARVVAQLEHMLSSDQFASCKAQGESWSPLVLEGKMPIEPVSK
jgi:hypothetical protein